MFCNVNNSVEKMTQKRYFAFFATLIILWTPLTWSQSAKATQSKRLPSQSVNTPARAPADLTKTQWLEKITTYLNSAQTWEADFEQLNPDGGLWVGKFYLQRPGRMRLVYTYPDEQKDKIMLADGEWLIVHDPLKDEFTKIGLKETPAYFFLKDKIDFSQDVKIENFDIEDGFISVSLVPADEPDAGSLILTFSQSPLKLVQWITIDANHLKTVINLKEFQQRQGKKYNPRFFTFDQPD